jgi:alpha-1,3-glucan synthase
MSRLTHSSESMTTKHLIQQFKMAINDALKSPQETNTKET